MKTITPKYRIELTCVSFVNKRRETHSYAYTGRATDKNAEKWRNDMNNSITNGHNQHLQKIHSPYGTATIIEQKTGKIAAQFVPPMFEVIN